MHTSSIGQGASRHDGITSLMSALSKASGGDADDGKSTSSVPAKGKAALPPGVGQILDKMA